VLVGGVVGDQVDQHPDTAPAGFLDQSVDVGEGTEVGVDGAVVSDVVAVVGQRRAVEREQPEAVNAEVCEVIQFAGQPSQIAEAIAIRVAERLDIHAVEDGVLVPQVGHGTSYTALRPGWPRGCQLHVRYQ
jgi:hypothetical protein